MSREAIKQHVKTLESSAKTLGYDISGPVSPFLKQLEAKDQMESQHDDFAMRPS